MHSTSKQYVHSVELTNKHSKSFSEAALTGFSKRTLKNTDRFNYLVLSYTDYFPLFLNSE